MQEPRWRPSKGHRQLKPGARVKGMRPGGAEVRSRYNPRLGGHILQFIKCFSWHGMDLGPSFLNDSIFSGLNYVLGKFFWKGLISLD